MGSRKLTTGAVAAAGVLTMTLAACASTPADDSDGTTLTVWGAVQSPTAEATRDEAERLFKKGHPDVKLEHVVIPAEQLTSKLLASAGTKSGPDVFSYNTVVDFHALEAAGVLGDLTEEWEAYPDKDQFPEQFVWRNGDDLVKTVFPYSDHIALFYNADILNELNQTPPETLEEFETVLDAVASSGKYQGLAQAGAPDTGGAWQFMPLLLQQGIGYCNYEGPQVAAAFERVNTWVEEGYLPKASAVWSQGDAWQQFSTGKFALGISGNWNLTAAEDLRFEWGTGQYPAGPEGSIVYLGGDGVAVGAFADEPELAWEYLKTSRLSKRGSLINFRGSGSLPTRADTASEPEIQNNEALAPFIDAMGTIHSWPNSPASAEMQLAVAEAVSGMISGQLSASAAADQATNAVAEALQVGGGDC